MTLLVYKLFEEYFNYLLHLLNSCLLHYLLSSDDSNAITLQKVVITSYISLLVITSPLLNHIKGNTSRFGSAIQVLPSDIGKYFSSL